MSTPAFPTRPSTPASAGVTEEMIVDLVAAFYAKVRRDAQLGPIFETAIAGDWPAHLKKLCAFWSSVMLMTGAFKGQPMAVHARLPGITPEHFDRWLALWRETTEEVCPPQAAALFQAKARTIGQSLQLGIAAARGEILPLSRNVS